MQSIDKASYLNQARDWQTKCYYRHLTAIKYRLFTLTVFNT